MDISHPAAVRNKDKKMVTINFSFEFSGEIIKKNFVYNGILIVLSNEFNFCHIDLECFCVRSVNKFQLFSNQIHD